MKPTRTQNTNPADKGVALVSVLLMTALLLILAMSISLTSISELGVSNTYANQSRAFDAAEAGLNHSVSLISNFQGTDFTALLRLRGSSYSDTFSGGIFNPSTASSYFYNAFDPSNAASFTAGCEMIPAAAPGRQMLDASGNSIPGTYYRVALIDDESSTRTSPAPNPSIPNFRPSGTWEDGDPTKDTNSRVVVYSTGTYGNSSVTLEGWIGFLPYPALVANGDISVGGSSAIDGAYGSVHANGNLSVGSHAYVQQSATATGSYSTSGNPTVGGFSGGGQPSLTIPKFVTTDPLTGTTTNTSPRLQDYLIQQADTILVDPGFAQGASTNPAATDAATVRLSNLANRLNVDYTSLLTALGSNSSASAVSISRNQTTGTSTVTPISNLSSTGWGYSGGNWSISSTAANAHTFYVVGVDNYNLANPSSSTANGGNVQISGNIGSSGSPLQITIFATGSFTVSGTPDIMSNLRNFRTPELPPYAKVDILMVGVEDVKINGDVNGGLVFNGIVYAGEQFYLSGNGAFNGQVISKSDPDVSGSPISSNTITGNFTLTLNNGNMVGTVSLISWRQLKL